MKSCIIAGYLGFIGRNLLKDCRIAESFERVFLIDKNEDELDLPIQFESIIGDICDLQEDSLDTGSSLDCIIHFAADCREPGYTREQYYKDNYESTIKVCDLAEKKGCKKVFFTSSMAVYGPTEFQAKENDHPLAPYAHYGASKLAAEWVLKEWQARGEDRQLIICRPGVIYGPDDVHNIPRMINAVKKGYFVLPSGQDVYKSYGYVKGLIDSIFFMLEQEERFILYNYVENENHTVSELAEIIKKRVGTKRPIFRMPYKLLMLLAKVSSALTFGKSPLHPVRVQKIATSTHLKPQKLIDMGFEFKWDFEKSLDDWFAEDRRFLK